VPWVKAILSKVFGLEQAVHSGKLRFVVIDGSTVQEPGATETSYRLHIAIDLVKLELLQVEVSTDKVGESLDHYRLGNGDVVIIDRGYNQPKSLVPFVDRGGEIVLRYNPHGMSLYHQNDEMTKVDWNAELKKLNGQEAGVFPVYLCYGNKRIEATVHAIPLPEEKAAEARRRTNQAAAKKGRTPKQETLYLSGWVLVLTTVPTMILNTETIAALYRLRWQVELVIKRLKSLLDIDCLRARKNSDLADIYLYGKLLYAAVIEKIAKRRFKLSSIDRMEERTLTCWRPWILVASEVQSWLISSMPAQMDYAADAIKALCERPRKRKLQTLPKRVCKLLEVCR
jgi:Transposase DDE domain